MAPTVVPTVPTKTRTCKTTTIYKEVTSKKIVKSTRKKKVTKDVTVTTNEDYVQKYKTVCEIGEADCVADQPFEVTKSRPVKSTKKVTSFEDEDIWREIEVVTRVPSQVTTCTP